MTLKEHDRPKLKVVFCWHMHQPDYRNLRDGEFQLPWTYLHAMKDYVDMVAHLENLPQARVVVNFTPILLEQIDDYSRQIQSYFRLNSVLKDPMLNALVDPASLRDDDHRRSLIKNCLRANEEHQINRFKPYQRLASMGHWLGSHPEQIRYVNGQYFVDLMMWYHLAWLGETVLSSNLQIKILVQKAGDYTSHDRRELLGIIGTLLKGLVPRYRTLMENGQIELSFSPYSHPIIPLLIDVNCARESMPDITLPVMETYPGGVERATWHLQQGIDCFTHFFGCKPKGCWLSEGGLSEAAIRLLDDFDIRWTAGGESVLRNSLSIRDQNHGQSKETFLYQPYRLTGQDCCSFFRDDELSDLIGFTYSEWHGDDAVANFVHRLETIDLHPETESGAVVSIILDGENAWDHYPDNAYHFLHGLYQSLSNHSRLQLVTFSDCLEDPLNISAELNNLVGGSWVYGTFSTWIGDEIKNRAWEMLADAKRSFDGVVGSEKLTGSQMRLAAKQLAICESSDWFWWFGDYNPAITVTDFERLYRMHLANLYQCIGIEPPAYLGEVFTHGSGNPIFGGVMRHGKE